MGGCLRPPGGMPAGGHYTEGGASLRECPALPSGGRRHYHRRRILPSGAMDSNPSPNDRVFQLLRERLASHQQLTLPPPCFLDMQADVVDFVDGESLTVRFPVLARYRNPLGFMQGGFIAAALDNTIGPFSYLVAPPSVTTQMTLSYLRPATPDLAYLECTATLLEKAGRRWIFSGIARGPDGKALVLAQAEAQVLG